LQADSNTLAQQQQINHQQQQQQLSFPSAASPALRMQLCDLLQDWIDGIPALPLNQLAFLAVTLVTAWIALYLLLDAWRYRSIPDLDVSLTAGEE
jgi:hypothetical protein